MAIKQIVPIFIQLQGDGSSVTFVFALQNLYQQSLGSSIPFGSQGVVPSSIVINNPPIPVTSSTVDSNGNVTITFTTAPSSGVNYSFEMDVIYNSGAATSSSATQSTNVTIVGSSSVTVSGTVAQNLTQVGGSTIALGQTTMSASLPVAIASNQAAIPVNIQSSGTALTNTSGSLNVNITGGSSGNAAAGTTGSAVPASASYTGFNSSGNLVGVSSSNPLPITGTVSASNPSVGTTGSTAPTSATEIGIVVSGNLVGVSSSNPIPVTASIAASQTIAVTQSTAASLNATVVGTGTFAVQATDNLTQVGGSAVVTAATGVIKVGDSDSLGQVQYNFPAGFVRTSDEPHQLLYDPFDSTLDTTNTWNTPVSGNGAVAASTSTGILTLGTGTTASGYSYLTSQNNFRPTVPSWIGYSFDIALPDGASPTANAYRFWGAGTVPTTPTTSAPMTNAVGFEMTTAGKLVAVVYAGGTRTQVQDFSSSTGNSTQPTDANYHRYIVYVRTDRVYWYIDTLATPAGTSNQQFPQVQTLPVALQATGGSTPPTSNTQIQVAGLAVWDTGKNNVQISDGTYPWRKTTVDSSGNLRVTTTPYQTFTTGTTWASGTTAGTFQIIDSPGSGPQPQAYIVQLDQGAGFTAGAITFQITGDGTNWVSINPQQVLDPTTMQPITVPYTLVSSTNRAFLIHLLGYSGLRLEVSTTTAGGSVTPYWQSINNLSMPLVSGIYSSPAPTLTAGQSVAMQVDVNGRQMIVAPVSTTASTPASTSVTSTSSAILASNTSRKECMITNTGVVVVYLGLGQTPTSSAYHVALSACSTAGDGTGGTYISDMWKGAINGITASTSGTVCVTELT